MGDRVSISFYNKENKEESIALFSHWGGMEFVRRAKQYVKDLKNKLRGRFVGTPIGRLEPNTVMVDFIREVTKDVEIVESDLYLGKDENCGDNSDNGHHKIKLN